MAYQGTLRIHARYAGRDSDYGRRWRAARLAFLQAHPLCHYCAQLGIVKPASAVDHVIPHRGNRVLFWDRDNWQPLCAPCHDGAKAQQERSGVLRGCDANGVPVDKAHHWQGGGLP